MRTVTITVAVLAVVASAISMSPETDRRVLPAQPAVASVADVSMVDSGAAQPAPVARCHIGHDCMLVILPYDDLAVTRLASTPELARLTDFQHSGTGYLPFHPPRILSQV